MNKEKIAILVDSGSDVPKELVKKHNMYVAPLNIIYKEEEYTDGVDIKTEDIYNRFDEEIPSTSLPSPATIQSIFDQIKADGYNKVLAVTISSGLSGTYNIIKMLGEQQDDLDVFVLDTKNVSLASGFHALQAAQYIDEGMNWDNLIKSLSRNISNTKGFLFVSTLKHLQKGGRIGLVTSVLGNAFNMKPIISCDDKGVLYTVAKVVGENRVIEKTIGLATEYIADAKKYNLSVVHAAAKEKAEKIKKLLVSRLPEFNIIIDSQISPALGIHGGPGAIGIIVQKL